MLKNISLKTILIILLGLFVLAQVSIVLVAISGLNIIRSYLQTESIEQAISALSTFSYYLILTVLVASTSLIAFGTWIAREILSSLNIALSALNAVSLEEIESNNLPNNESNRIAEAIKRWIDSNTHSSNILLSIAKGDNSFTTRPSESKIDSFGISITEAAEGFKQLIANYQKELKNLTSSSCKTDLIIAEAKDALSETIERITTTAAGVEDLRHFAQLTDQRASNILITSQKTFEILDTCEKSLQDTINEMGEIDEKMHVISNGIIKLNENSQTIGEILDTVNELAEQSNLLAVNAALEAAKAGENGKSFTIVALEIRTLAEQSKSATIQIRTILNEIQNSTGAVVIASEQGAKAVEKGVKQSIKTNETMEDLSLSMKNMTQTTSQITASSQKNFEKIDQVENTIRNIRQSTEKMIETIIEVDKEKNQWE